MDRPKSSAPTLRGGAAAACSGDPAGWLRRGVHPGVVPHASILPAVLWQGNYRGRQACQFGSQEPAWLLVRQGEVVPDGPFRSGELAQGHTLT